MYVKVDVLLFPMVLNSFSQYVQIVFQIFEKRDFKNFKRKKGTLKIKVKFSKLNHSTQNKKLYRLVVLKFVCFFEFFRRSWKERKKERKKGIQNIKKEKDWIASEAIFGLFGAVLRGSKRGIGASVL